jgi:hypothetical protein
MEMKIAALYPVGVEPELEEVAAALLQGYASPGTEITPFLIQISISHIPEILSPVRLMRLNMRYTLRKTVLMPS